MKSRKKLLHLLWWRDHLVAQKSDKMLSDKDWANMAVDRYEEFRANDAPNIARAGSSGMASSTAATAVTKNQVNEFQKGHRRNVSVYMSYTGDRRFWF